MCRVVFLSEMLTVVNPVRASDDVIDQQRTSSAGRSGRWRHLLTRTQTWYRLLLRLPRLLCRSSQKMEVHSSFCLASFVGCGRFQQFPLHHCVIRWHFAACQTLGLLFLNRAAARIVFGSALKHISDKYKSGDTCNLPASRKHVIYHPKTYNQIHKDIFPGIRKVLSLGPFQTHTGLCCVCRLTGIHSRGGDFRHYRRREHENLN